MHARNRRKDAALRDGADRSQTGKTLAGILEIAFLCAPEIKEGNICSPLQKCALCRRKKAARKRLLLTGAVLLHVEADGGAGKRTQPVSAAVREIEVQLRRMQEIRLSVRARCKRQICLGGADNCAACRSSRCDRPDVPSYAAQ